MKSYVLRKLGLRPPVEPPTTNKDGTDAPGFCRLCGPTWADQVATTTVVSGDSAAATTAVRLLFGTVAVVDLLVMAVKRQSALGPGLLLAGLDVASVLFYELRLEELHGNEWAVDEYNGHATKHVYRHGRVWRAPFQKLIRFVATDKNLSVEINPRTRDNVPFTTTMTFPAELSEHIAEQRGSTRGKSRVYHIVHDKGEGQAAADDKLKATARSFAVETWSGVDEKDASGSIGLVADITEAKLRLRHWDLLLPVGISKDDHFKVVEHFRQPIERAKLQAALKAEPLSSHFTDAEIDAGKHVAPGLKFGALVFPEAINTAHEVVTKARADAEATVIGARARGDAYDIGVQKAKGAGVTGNDVGVNALMIADLATDGIAVAGKRTDGDGLLMEVEVGKNKGKKKGEK